MTKVVTPISKGRVKFPAEYKIIKTIFSQIRVTLMMRIIMHMENSGISGGWFSTSRS